jgi:hypothetical protein
MPIDYRQILPGRQVNEFAEAPKLLKINDFEIIIDTGANC